MFGNCLVPPAAPSPRYLPALAKDCFVPEFFQESQLRPELFFWDELCSRMRRGIRTAPKSGSLAGTGSADRTRRFPKIPQGIPFPRANPRSSGSFPFPGIPKLSWLGLNPPGISCWSWNGRDDPKGNGMLQIPPRPCFPLGFSGINPSQGDGISQELHLGFFFPPLYGFDPILPKFGNGSAAPFGFPYEKTLQGWNPGIPEAGKNQIPNFIQALAPFPSATSPGTRGLCQAGNHSQNPALGQQLRQTPARPRKMGKDSENGGGGQNPRGIWG